MGQFAPNFMIWQQEVVRNQLRLPCLNKSFVSGGHGPRFQENCKGGFPTRSEALELHVNSEGQSGARSLQLKFVASRKDGRVWKRHRSGQFDCRWQRPFPMLPKVDIVFAPCVSVRQGLDPDKMLQD